MRTVQQMIAAANATKTCAPSSCLHTCSEWWLERSSGEDNAQLDWIATPGKLRLKPTSTPELGMLAHWAHTAVASARHGLPTGQPGHIAPVVLIGADGGVWVRSTDMKALYDASGRYVGARYAPGSVDTVRLEDVTRAMGLVFSGYARQIAGVLVVPKPPKKPAPRPAPSPAALVVALVTVVVANIKSNPVMRVEDVRADEHRVFVAAKNHHAAAVFGAEIVAPPVGPAYYRNGWKALSKAFGYRYFAGDEVPISLKASSAGLDRAATFIAHALHALTRGIAGVSPTRYCNVVKAYVTASDGSPIKVAFVNTHLNPQSTAKSHPEQIKTQIHLVRMRCAQLRAAGYVVIVGGDLNHTGTVAWGSGQVDVFPAVGPMAQKDLQLAVLCPVGVTAHATGHGAVLASELHTDHPIRWGTVQLSKEAA